MGTKRLALVILISFYLIIYSMDRNIQIIDIPQTLAKIKAQELVDKRKKQLRWKRSPESLDFETQYQKILEDYMNFEENLNIIRKKPRASFGEINYGMTLEEIKQKLWEKFKEFKKEGLIITHEEFEKIKDNYFNKPSQDLTRIWGADYLKNKINQSEYLKSKYAVPNYIIVANNLNHLIIRLDFNQNFPIATALKNAEIYFEKISGPHVASWYSLATKDIGISSGIGYDDFSDPGNIIFDSKSGKFYIVDTEFKSFKFPIKGYLSAILPYASERFKYLNNVGIDYIYSIDL